MRGGTVLFQESPRKELLFLMIHVGKQDSLTQIVDTAASGVEFSNGKN